MFNIFSMSDEELMKLDPSQISQMTASSTGTSAENTDEENENTDETGQGEAQGDSEAQGTAGADSAGAGDDGQANQDENTEAQANEPGASDPGLANAGESAKTDAAKDAAAVDGAVSNTPQTSESKPADANTVDYKAEYEKLTAPFTANGREIRVKSVDDAIALMQMGANYNKKMAALKPNLKLMRLLENNGLLNEEKINFLIDLEKKTPGAVNKLIKDSGLDPLELDGGKADEYKPTTRTVDDREIELDEVIGDIASTPTYQRTIEIVTKEWDVPSKRIVADSPQLLKVINEHVRTGVFDMIRAEVENERMFGRLQGISDIEAYRQVGDSLNARGAFDRLGATAQQQQTAPAQTVIAPNPKQVNDEKLNDKRRAAAAAKPAATPPKPAKEFNPLALSDDEFAKLASQKF